MADLGNTAVISPTDNSNGSGTMPSWLGSAAPSTLDDAGRALQGAVAREWQNRSFTVTSSGTAPNFVVAYTVAPAAYRTGQVYSFIAHAAAVGSETANINTLGAKNLKKVVAGSKTALAANDFYAGDFLMFAYDGTDLVWCNRGGGGYTAGGTDVAIADGGTGQSTATAGFDALAPTTTQGDIIYHNGTDNVRLATGTNGQVLTSGGAGANPSWTTVSSGLAAASQAEQETGSSTAVAVTPGRQHFHQSAAKFWVAATANSTTIIASYNMTSWADTTVGNATGTIATDFSSANWSGNMTIGQSMAAFNRAWCATMDSLAAGTFEVWCATTPDATDANTSAQDPSSWLAQGFGDI